MLSGFFSEKRAESEDALRAQDERYRTFFRTSRDPIFITSKEGLWIDFNDATVELFGYENRDELREVRIPDIYEDPEERKRHTHLIEQQGFTKESAVNLRKKDGSIINTLITSVARKDVNGNAIDYQGTIKDITDRKRAEDKVKKAYRLREHFLKETSHRIITPVAIIGGCTQLLLESNTLDDDQKKKIRIMQARNAEVQKLVRDALAGKYLEEEAEEAGEG